MGPGPLELILVGDGARARRWAELAERSPKLSVVGRVDADGVSEALRDQPRAVVLGAVGPRSATDLALALAAADRRGLVAAPLHVTALPAAPPVGAHAVQLDHGWCTLSGPLLIRREVERGGLLSGTLEVLGTPSGEDAESLSVFAHALSLVARLSDECALVAVTPMGPEATLRVGPVTLDVRCRPGPGQLSLSLEGPAGHLTWAVRDGHETFHMRRTGGARRELRTHPADVRALSQLLDPETAGGDDLSRAWPCMELLREAIRRAPGLALPGLGALHRSAVRLEGDPGRVGRALGLSGDVPEGEAAATTTPVSIAEPYELFAFRAGLKPVAFLTVRPDAVDATLALFGDVSVERRRRRVRIEAQDAWIDRRDEGEERVELYLSKDADLARRAAELQASGDPSANLRALGDLLGYPACCIAAFELQARRGNNSLNRYRAAARTEGDAPWFWELNDLSVKLVPFFPCNYRCLAAQRWARATWNELLRAHPEAAERLALTLKRPVLYFDHDHQLQLGGTCDRQTARYNTVFPVDGAKGMAGLCAAIAAGDELRLDDEAISVRRQGDLICRLIRVDPALGMLAPFGDPS